MCSKGKTMYDENILAKFMKGVFTRRPNLPRYNVTWDTGLVLRLLETWSPLSKLSLLRLSQKLVTLMLLLSGQRGQTMHLLKCCNIECNDEMLILRIDELLKTSGPSSHLGEIVLPAYRENKNLCVVHTYRVYLTRTMQIRKSENLFISSQRPFTAVSRDTISRWVKIVLKEAGISPKLFGPHSTRAAATSQANFQGVPLATIIKTAGWSKDQTFRKHYNKPITRDPMFARAILENR